MGLIFNHMSASAGGANESAMPSRQDGQGRNAAGVTGSLYFSPALHVSRSDGFGHAIHGFPGHKDAAYIFSGSAHAAATDKAVFLGNVVISGSLSLGDGGSFLEGTMVAGRVPFATDPDTLTVDHDLVFNPSGSAFANTGKAGRLELGDAAGDDVGIRLSAGDLNIFADDEAGDKVAGLVTNTSTKLNITGAYTGGKIGLEMGATKGVVLGQGTDSAGFIQIQTMAANGDADGADPAIKVASAAGGILLNAANDKKIMLSNSDGSQAIALIDDSTNSDASTAISIGGSVGSISVGTTASAKNVSVSASGGGDQHLQLSSAGTSADAVDISASGAAGGVHIEAESNAGTVVIKGDHESGTAIHIDGNAADASIVDIDAGSLLMDSGADVVITTGTTFDVNSTGNIVIDSDGRATHGAARFVFTADGGAGSGTVSIDTNDTTNGVTIGTANSGVPIVIGHGTSETTVQDNLSVKGNLTISDNLIVGGSTTTVDTTNLLVEDPMIVLGIASGSLSTAGDRGVLFGMDGAAGGSPALIWDDGGSYEAGTFKRNGEFVLAYCDNTGSESSWDVVHKAPLAVGAVKSSALTDNRVVIAGTAGVLEDDANLTFDGNDLALGANIGLTFGTGEKIEGDDTDLTVTSGGKINLTATSDVLLPVNVGLVLDGAGGEKIESDGTDLKVQSSGLIKLMSAAANGTDIEEFLRFASGSAVVEVQPQGTVTDTDLVFKESGGNEIFRVDASADALLMATTRQIQLGAAARNITDASNDIVITSGADVRIAGTSKLEFNTDNSGEHIVHDGTNLEVVSGAGLELKSAAHVSIEAGQELRLRGLADSTEKIHSTGNGLVDIDAGTAVLIAAGGSGETLRVTSTGIVPASDNALNLGTASARFNNIFTGDLNLRNDRGDWTLIEENDFISFRNNKTGRRFRMVMEDITGTGTYGPGNDGEM